jgi:hypothetical protein
MGAASVAVEDFAASPLGPLAVGTTDIGRFSVTINSNAEGGVRIQQPGNINGTRELNGDIDADANSQLDFSGFGTLIGFAGTWRSTASGDLLTVTVNGTTFEFDNFLTGVGNEFFGIADTAGFSLLQFGTETFTTFGEAFQLDDAQLATRADPTVVSAPGTLALFGIALAALGIRRRRATA